MKVQRLIKESAIIVLVAGLTAGSLGACSDGNNDDGNGVEAPATYTYESTFNEGESSVGYGGQTYRHSLIIDLVGEVEGVDDTTHGDNTQADIEEALTYFYENADGSTASDQLPYDVTPSALQTTYSELASGRDLAGKIAGSPGEASTQYVDDWAQAFTGWDPTVFAPTDGAVDTPDALVKALIEKVAYNASERALNSVERDDPTGSTTDPLPSHVTTDGQNLAQLLEKFLWGAVTYSQGTDDYLDDDVDGKGLLADNTEPRSEGASSTALEHAWDEGFGYFGAARDYLDYSDEEIAGAADSSDRNEYYDTDGDGTIDLTAEYNFGHSAYAAKRDIGSSGTTNYTRQAFEGFARGREIIRLAQTDGNGALTDAEFEQLVQARDDAILAWEHAIASSVVHYLNSTLADMARFGSEDYSFLSHAAHWSEMKAFALSLQFNPRMQMSADDFATLHQHIGMKPVIEGVAGADQQAVESYRTALKDARDLLRNAYEFTYLQVSNW